MPDISPFRVALTHDFYDDQYQLKYPDIGLGTFAAHSHIQAAPIASRNMELAADDLTNVNGVIVLTPRVSAKTVSSSDQLLAVGRFGVGYDSVDVPACTESDVLAFITVGAVDRSVAEATVAWMLALTHHVSSKDRLVRENRWDDRNQYMGCELRGRTLGVIGLGGIGRATVSLLQGFGMNPPIAFDPYLSEDAAAELGVRLLGLQEVMSQADFVSVHCPLSESTRGLIGAQELKLMKPNAYLINTARGQIVDEKALFEALKNRRIAGAAVDCFDIEPLPGPHPLGELDNVLLAPHCIAWTDELFLSIGSFACQAMVDLSLGKRPKGVLNRELFERPSFRNKWEAIVGREVE